MEAMSAQARGLATTAQQLKTMVDHFNIDQEAPPAHQRDPPPRRAAFFDRKKSL